MAMHFIIGITPSIRSCGSDLKKESKYGSVTNELWKACTTIELLGIPLSTCNKEQLLAGISYFAGNKQKSLILSGNVYSFNLAYEKPWLNDLFKRATIVRLDGAGLRQGARLLGYDTPPRMTWADFAWDLAALCTEKGHSLYFLGGQPHVAARAAEKLRERFPGLMISGSHHGFFNKQPGHPENTAVLDEIREHKPDILVVGMGMPLQERWLVDNEGQIEATVTMTGGAVFDYISGELRRAPEWMTDNGMEWLGRLLIEPGRLWRRYILGNPLFFSRILRERFAG